MVSIVLRRGEKPWESSGREQELCKKLLKLPEVSYFRTLNYLGMTTK